MGFWDTFWATVWGALAGAFVGALASWGFALDLRRRDGKNAHRDTMTRHLGMILQGLTMMSAELLQPRARVPIVGAGAPSPVRTARFEVLAAIEAAMLDARDGDFAVLIATRQAVETTPHGHEGSVRASFIGTLLSGWWREGKDHKRSMTALAKLSYDDDGKPLPRQL